VSEDNDVTILETEEEGDSVFVSSVGHELLVVAIRRSDEEGVKVSIWFVYL